MFIRVLFSLLDIITCKVMLSFIWAGNSSYKWQCFLWFLMNCLFFLRNHWNKGRNILSLLDRLRVKLTYSNAQLNFRKMTTHFTGGVGGRRKKAGRERTDKSTSWVKVRDKQPPVIETTNWNSLQWATGGDVHDGGGAEWRAAKLSVLRLIDWKANNQLWTCGLRPLLVQHALSACHSWNVLRTDLPRTCSVKGASNWRYVVNLFVCVCLVKRFKIFVTGNAKMQLKYMTVN